MCNIIAIFKNVCIWMFMGVGSEKERLSEREREGEGDCLSLLKMPLQNSKYWVA